MIFTDLFKRAAEMYIESFIFKKILGIIFFSTQTRCNRLLTQMREDFLERMFVSADVTEMGEGLITLHGFRIGLFWMC